MKNKFWRSVKFWSAVSAALFVFATVVMVHDSAQVNAAELNVISNVTITGSATTIRVDDTVTLQANWSAATAAENDTFTINFPSTPQFQGAPAIFALKNASDETIANCNISATQAVCTFTDYANTHINMSGNFYFSGQFKQTSTGATVNFTTGTGVTIPVAVPGGGIAPKANLEIPDDPFKDGRTVDTDADGVANVIEWSVYSRGDDLVTPGGGSTTLTDTYDSRQAFVAGSVEVYTVTFEQWESGSPFSYIIPVDASAYNITDDAPNHQFEIAFDPAQVDQSLMYIIQYQLHMPISWNAGDTFTNTITGDNIASFTGSVVVSASGGNAEGFPYREIALTKSIELDGNSAALTDAASATFTFAISCTENGTALDGYPTTVDVVAGQRAEFKTIPVGATCTIDETNSGGAAEVRYDFTNPIDVTVDSPPVIELVATNVFRENPDPTPSPNPDVTPGVPNTGRR